MIRSAFNYFFLCPLSSRKNIFVSNPAQDPIDGPVNYPFTFFFSFFFSCRLQFSAEIEFHRRTDAIKAVIWADNFNKATIDIASSYDRLLSKNNNSI